MDPQQHVVQSVVHAAQIVVFGSQFFIAIYPHFASAGELTYLVLYTGCVALATAYLVCRRRPSGTLVSILANAASVVVAAIESFTSAISACTGASSVSLAVSASGLQQITTGTVNNGIEFKDHAFEQGTELEPANAPEKDSSSKAADKRVSRPSTPPCVQALARSRERSQWPS